MPRRTPFGTYEGTLQSIAALLHERSGEFGWLDDQIKEDADIPLSESELNELLRLFRDEQIIGAASLPWDAVDPATLLSPQDFDRLATGEAAARRDWKGAESLRTDPAYAVLLDAPTEITQRLGTELTDLLREADSICQSMHPWARECVRQILGGQDSSWRGLRKSTKDNLQTLGERAGWADETTVTGLGNRDLQTVKADAQALVDHLETGGGWGFVVFRPAPVKQALHLRREVRVGGRRCDNLDALHDLIHKLDVELRFEALGNHWSQYTDIASASFAAQLGHYQDLCEFLDRALDLCEPKVRIQNLISRIPTLPKPGWHDLDGLRTLRDAVHAVEMTRALGGALRALDREVRKLEILDTSRVDPAVKDALAAIRSRDVESYRRAHGNIAANYRTRQALERRSALQGCLSSAAPRLATGVAESPNDPVWDERFQHFTDAWNWARAKVWIRRLCDPAEGERLRLRLDDTGSQVRRCLQQIAAEKAWQHCFKRMTEIQRQHLVAWAKAMRAVGKGTGKYAAMHRRAAREHMSQCRSAIPVWIMPTYRVAQTIQPGRELFDVVIVDEASQSGPEALLLTYLAKKMVVVGDDKQIAPQFVGTDQADVNHLRERYITHLPHSDRYGVDDSFFDLAEIRYPGRIRLREHFRCMPEIIQFSNNLYYRAEPLIPLKQYGANRLEPVIQVQHVADGYREGRGQSVVNPPEAQAVADAIVKCTNDDKYAGKTFGVISLQGPYQARKIESLLLNQLGPEEMERRHLVCGDAYAFQGDERDVIFLSLVAAPSGETRIGTLTKASDERRFNVAASRAREQMWLFHTAELSDLSPKGQRYKLLDYCRNPKVEPTPMGGISIGELEQRANDRDRDEKCPPPFDSWFEVDVFLCIVRRGYRVIPQYELAGYRIDLVVEGMKGRLAVECDGDQWHGPDRYDEDTARQRMLERCGLTFCRIRGSAFALDREEALVDLWQTLDRLKIHPEGAEPPGQEKDSGHDLPDGPLNNLKEEEKGFEEV